MKTSRRTFLKIGAATTSALAAYKFFEPVIEEDIKDVLRPLAQSAIGQQEKFIPTTCLQCPAGCGVIVRVVDGNAVKIEGNPLSPNNRGGICPKGHLGLHFLYDPDRIKGPMYRSERGSDNWKSLSWKEAIDMFAQRLADLRKAGEPHRFVWQDGRVRGNQGSFLANFVSAYGTPNRIGHSNICSDGVKAGHYITQGIKDYLGYDWERTNYILAFGAGVIEAWRPTTRLLRVYGKIRRERPVRAKIVVVDTRLSISAAKADEWIPINPGTDGALALAIAHVIVNEKLYDKKFIEEHTTGFEEFKELVEKEYSPEWAEKITGVPADTITRMAREFAATRPAIAEAQRGAIMWSNGALNSAAIYALNALVGSIGIPGGVLVQRGPPFKAWPKVEQDDIAAQGVKKARIDLAGSEEYPFASNNLIGIADALTTGKPYKPSIIMTYYNNPLFSQPEPEKIYEAYTKADFNVSTSPYMGEYEQFAADLILPDDMYLERWHDDVIYPSVGYPYASIRQPVVERLYDTMNTGDVVLALGKRLAELGHPTVAKTLPFDSYLDAIKYRWSGIFESNKGRVGSIPVKDMATFDQFWNALLKYGYWADPPYKFGDWKNELRTDSGKFEFVSGKIEHALEDLAKKKAQAEGISVEEAEKRLLEKWNIKADKHTAVMPHWEEPLVAGDAANYPFFLNTYKLMMHAEGRGSNSPWVLEHLSPMFPRYKFETWVEINPEDATKLGIKTGDKVWVENPNSKKIKVVANLFEGAKPGVVNIPFELGHKAYGRWAKDTGANPNDLIIDEWQGKLLRERFSASTNYFATRVKIYKAEVS